MKLSVIIPTHNPVADRLCRTVTALRSQSLPSTDWELVIVDNASNNPALVALLDLRWHPAARIIREEALGLTPARCRGLRESTGEIVVFVDDDNLLRPDYLATVAERFRTSAMLGAAGGRSVPEFEVPPAPWHYEFFSLLALRDLGEQPLVARRLRDDPASPNRYPACAPIGAGMAVRRAALDGWTAHDTLPDRCGASLTSGGDNEIVFRVLTNGWDVAYFPDLVLTHLIPAARLQPAYLGRLNRGIQSSWIQILHRYGANRWTPLGRTGALLRQGKAWFRCRAWASPAARVRWQGSCGHFDGRYAISRVHSR